MYQKSYSNFVKASSPETPQLNVQPRRLISGEEAQKLYLEEVKDAKVLNKPSLRNVGLTGKRKKNTDQDEVPLSNKNLFIIVQNNDVDRLNQILDKYPDKITTVDEYGWSLLMIACQANCTQMAEELLKRGIDISVRDKAGNSARSLVIKNKNYELANILLNYIRKDSPQEPSTESAVNFVSTIIKKNEFTCEVCNKTYLDKEEHLSSTLHNINASKGRKIPANYIIPQTNKGYQLMVKVGWDRDSGLGKDGSGKKYPIKAIQKKDRKGLGHVKPKTEKLEQVNVKHKNKVSTDHHKNRRFEINFRREFY